MDNHNKNDVENVSEKWRKEVVIKKKDNQKEETRALISTINLEVQAWVGGLFEFPKNINVLSISENELQFRRELSKPDDFDNIFNSCRYYLSIKKPANNGDEDFIEADFLRDVLKKLFSSKSNILEYVPDFIQNENLGYFYGNLNEFKEDEITRFLMTAKANVNFVCSFSFSQENPESWFPKTMNPIVEKFPLGSVKRLVYYGLIIGILSLYEFWHDHDSSELITFEPDSMNVSLLEKLVWAEWIEAWGDDGDGLVFEVPKISSFVYPWSKLDEDGFKIKG
ncbi:hypothetical protein AGMMS50268_40160 [Spirochaetia bacterium]|nr:hypothetical protein AGMMS50268_40160 [Spirochaetia bacterium]